MAGGTEETVLSTPMEASPAIDPRTAVAGTPAPTTRPAGAAPMAEVEPDPEGLSLARRLWQPRTILSLVLPIVLLVLIFRVALNVDVNELATGVQRANPALLVAAFVVFYLGFPLRGFRWSLLLRGSEAAMTNLSDPTRYSLLGVPFNANAVVKASMALGEANGYPFAEKRNRALLELQYRNLQNTLPLFEDIISDVERSFVDDASTDNDYPYELFPISNATNGGYTRPGGGTNPAKYVVDTGASHTPGGPRHIRVFDVVDGARLVNGRVFADMAPGTSDGIRADRAGNIWASAGWGGEGFDGVHCFAPDGTLIGRIHLPEAASNLCFGGAKKNRLFITASQSLYSLYVEARGAQTP